MTSPRARNQASQQGASATGGGSGPGGTGPGGSNKRASTTFTIKTTSTCGTESLHHHSSGGASGKRQEDTAASTEMLERFLGDHQAHEALAVGLGVDHRKADKTKTTKQ